MIICTGCKKSWKNIVRVFLQSYGGVRNHDAAICHAAHKSGMAQAYIVAPCALIYWRSRSGGSVLNL